MTTSTRRSLFQTIPLALLVLGIGVARRDASGASLVDTGRGLLARARSMVVELRDTFESPAASATPSPPSATPPSLEVPQTALGTFPTPRTQIRSFCSRHCQH